MDNNTAPVRGFFDKINRINADFLTAVAFGEGWFQGLDETFIQKETNLTKSSQQIRLLAIQRLEKPS
jgi:hypothetical protein